MTTILEGGCLCDGCRYRVEGGVIDAGYCHCRMCQRSAGAPVMTWFTVPAGGFAWTRGELHTYRSSDVGERAFCPSCGTQLTFRDRTTPQEVDVNLVTLDEPAVIRPQYHIWTASRQPWLVVDDDLPRYPDGGVDERRKAKPEGV